MNNGARQWPTLSPVHSIYIQWATATKISKIIRNIWNWATLNKSGGNIKNRRGRRKKQSIAIIFNLLQKFHKNDNKLSQRTGWQRNLQQIMFACRSAWHFYELLFLAVTHKWHALITCTRTPWGAGVAPTAPAQRQLPAGGWRLAADDRRQSEAAARCPRWWARMDIIL